MEFDIPSGGAAPQLEAAEGQMHSPMQDLVAVTREQRRAYAALVPMRCAFVSAVQTISSSA
eukprot:12934995-Prorocentrum_lima.AAC.1